MALSFPRTRPPGVLISPELRTQRNLTSEAQKTPFLKKNPWPGMPTNKRAHEQLTRRTLGPESSRSEAMAGTGTAGRLVRPARDTSAS